MHSTVRSFAALLFGALAAFVAIYFGMVGLAAGIVLMAAGVAYLGYHGRLSDLSLMSLGGGVTVLLLVGRPLLASWVDPATTVATPTYLAVAVGVALVAIAGFLWLAQLGRHRSRV